MTACYICQEQTGNPEVPCARCQRVVLSDVNVFANARCIPSGDVNEVHKEVLLHKYREAAPEPT